MEYGRQFGKEGFLKKYGFQKRGNAFPPRGILVEVNAENLRM